jgi:hypothetical protein
MFGIACLILVILPILFQLIVGSKTIFFKNSTKLKFGKISLISFISQIIFSIAAIYIANYNLSKYFDEHPNSTRCGMPFFGVLMSIIFFIIVLCIIILLQFFIKILKERKAK